MSVSIGLVELRSIPVGYELCDAMLKSADVELVRAAPACPGKFLIMVSGAVGAVKAACATAQTLAHKRAVMIERIDNIHDDVVRALKTREKNLEIKSLGSVECRAALGAIVCADVIVKSGNVSLISVRLAQGIGGKGYVNYTGDIAAVKAAMDTCKQRCGDTVGILETCVIATPHKDLLAHLV